MDYQDLAAAVKKALAKYEGSQDDPNAGFAGTRLPIDEEPTSPAEWSPQDVRGPAAANLWEKGPTSAPDKTRENQELSDAMTLALTPGGSKSPISRYGKMDATDVGPLSLMSDNIQEWSDYSRGRPVPKIDPAKIAGAPPRGRSGGGGGRGGGGQPAGGEMTPASGGDYTRDQFYAGGDVPDITAERVALKGALDKYLARPTKMNLSPLIALVDSWTGSNLSAGYRPPESPEEKEAATLKVRQWQFDQAARAKESQAKLRQEAQKEANWMRVQAWKDAKQEEQNRIREAQTQSHERYLMAALAGKKDAAANKEAGKAEKGFEQQDKDLRRIASSPASQKFLGQFAMAEAARASGKQVKPGEQWYDPDVGGPYMGPVIDRVMDEAANLRTVLQTSGKRASTETLWKAAITKVKADYPELVQETVEE
jgi:hypothetical protein